MDDVCVATGEAVCNRAKKDDEVERFLADLDAGRLSWARRRRAGDAPEDERRAALGGPRPRAKHGESSRGTNHAIAHPRAKHDESTRDTNHAIAHSLGRVAGSVAGSTRFCHTGSVENGTLAAAMVGDAGTVRGPVRWGHQVVANARR